MLNGMEFQTVGAAYLKALRPTAVPNLYLSLEHDTGWLNRNSQWNRVWKQSYYARFVSFIIIIIIINEN